MLEVRRPTFVTLPAAATVGRSLAARTVGFLVSASPGGYQEQVAMVRRGMSELGYAEGRNVAFDDRWGYEQYDRLPALAAGLVRRQVAAIFTTGSAVSALAAKAATATTPIVFTTGNDPVKIGLVDSLARPGGNATGISFYNPALGPKRLDLLREMLPKVKTVAFLVNPRNPNVIDTEHLQAAAHLVGVRMAVVSASSERELEGAFAEAVRRGADVLIVHTDALFHSHSQAVVALAARHALPAMWSSRRFVASGGLISYGTNIPEMYRQAGVYLGRILEGEEPADLPVLQPTKFELVINLKAAKALGLDVPSTLLARADEIIE